MSEQEVKAAYQAAIDSQLMQIKALEKTLLDQRGEIDRLRVTLLQQLPEGSGQISLDRNSLLAEREILRMEIDNLKAGSQLLVHSRGHVELENKRLSAAIERRRVEAAAAWETHEKQLAELKAELARIKALLLEALKILDQCRDLLFATTRTPNVAAFLGRADVMAFVTLLNT